MTNVACVSEKNFSDLYSGKTVNRGKYITVDSLIVQLKSNKSVFTRLSVERAKLQKNGFDLGKKDVAKLSKAKENIEHLTEVIEEQIKAFHLTYEKINGEYIYRSRGIR